MLNGNINHVSHQTHSRHQPSASGDFEGVRAPPRLAHVKGLNFKSTAHHRGQPFELEMRPSLDRIRELRESRLVERDVMAMSQEHLIDSITRIKREVEADPVISGLERRGLGGASTGQHTCNCIVENVFSITGKLVNSDNYLQHYLIDVLYVPKAKKDSSLLVKAFPVLNYTLSRRYIRYPKITEEMVLKNPRCISRLQKFTRDRLGCSCTHAAFAEAMKNCQRKMSTVYSNLKAAMCSALVRVTGWFFLRLLPDLFQSITVSRHQMERLKEAHKEGHSVVYLPLHRSHLDYTLLPLVLWANHLPLPYVAAGDNLNIPVIGSLLRGFGGFFIRRSSDRSQSVDADVYQSVLQTYMEVLISQGCNLEFYLEAGRSRTGRSRQAKLGLLSGVVKAYLDGLVPDVTIVPMSVSYEIVPDANFDRELLGGNKTPETFLSSLRGMLSFLRRDYGMVRFTFCQPFTLSQFLRNCSSVYLQPESSQLANGHPHTSAPINGVAPNLSLNTLTMLSDVGLPTEALDCVHQLGSHVLFMATHTQGLMVTHLMAFSLLYQHRRQGACIDTLEASVKDLSHFFSHQLAFRGNWKQVIRRGCRYLQPWICVTPALGISPSPICNPSPHALDNPPVVEALSSPSAIFHLAYYAQPVVSQLALEAVFCCAVARCVGLVSDCSYSTRSSIPLKTVNTLVCRLVAILEAEFPFIRPCSSLPGEVDRLLQWWNQFMTKSDDERELDVCMGVDDLDTRGRKRKEDPDQVRVDLDNPRIVDRLTWLCRCIGPLIECYWYTVSAVIKYLQSESLSEAQFVSQLMTTIRALVNSNKVIYVECACKESVQNCLKSMARLGLLERSPMGPDTVLLTCIDLIATERLLRDLETYLIL